jgi:hypothetical protein
MLRYAALGAAVSFRSCDAAANTVQLLEAAVFSITVCLHV